MKKGTYLTSEIREENIKKLQGEESKNEKVKLYDENRK
jgi:hypothetical protein